MFLCHNRNEITGIADDAAGIWPVEYASMTLYFLENSILADIETTQASLQTEVNKTFDQLLDLLLQKVTPHAWPIAMQTARESNPLTSLFASTNFAQSNRLYR